MNRRDALSLGLVILLLSATAVRADSTVVCQSFGNDHHYCSADTSGGVTLVHQTSKSGCWQGDTWGYDSRGIWVSNGCSAEFQVGGSESTGKIVGQVVGGLLAAGILGALASDQGDSNAYQNNERDWGGSSDTGRSDWGGSRGGLILYRDLHFTGASQGFDQDVPDLRGSRIGDDQTTSARVEWGCRARLYRDPNYRGTYTEVNGEISDLRGTQVGDDSVTSIQVRCQNPGWGGSGGGSNQQPEYGLTLYRDSRFAGTQESFARSNPDLRRSRIGDDHATSARVSRGCRARLYQDLSYQGGYTEVTGDVPDLRGSRVGDDSTTSVEVQCGGGGSWVSGGGGGGGRLVVSCESHGSRRQYCATGYTEQVELRRQRSTASCQYNRSWGYDRNGIWVSNGCRGEFWVYDR